MDFISINPATGQEIARYPALDAAATEAAITDAAAAPRRWRRAALSERAEVLEAAASLLDAEADRLAALMATEMGKPFREGVGEAKKCAWVCRYYAEHGATFLADEPAASDASRSWIRYEPLGVILGVMPWNFPLWQVFRMAAPTLMAGNTILLKHAKNVSGCAAAIEDIWQRAGAPRGVYRDLRVPSSAIAAVIDDPRVAAVTLTGSTRAGRLVASQAGRALMPAVLELGGSDPCVVMPSADLDEAVAVGLRSRTLNSGQSCIAAKRFIVHEAIADEFEARFVAAMEALRVGDPMDDEVEVGPIATGVLRDGLADQVRRSVEAGAKVLLGGEPIEGPGFFYPPTVLSEIPPGTPAYDDELFGPVASLFRVPDLDAAVALANGTIYGLGASAWTRDEAEISRLVDELEAGAVFINGMVKSDPRLPFGGIKGSGFGRELGREGIRALCNIKTVWIG